MEESVRSSAENRLPWSSKCSDFPTCSAFDHVSFLGPSDASLSSSVLRSQGPRKVRPKILQTQNLSIALSICWIGALLCHLNAAYNSGSTPRAMLTSHVGNRVSIQPKKSYGRFLPPDFSEKSTGYRCLWLR